MIVKDYIKQKFQSFGIQLSEADLWDMCLNSEVSGEDEMGLDDMRQISVAVTRFIPSLLLRPSSIGESGFSISRAQRADIEYFYSIQCQELGIPNQLKPKVSFVRR